MRKPCPVHRDIDSLSSRTRDPTLPTSETWGWKPAGWQCGLSSQSEVRQLRGTKLSQESTPKRCLPLKALGQMLTNHKFLITPPHTHLRIFRTRTWGVCHCSSQASGTVESSLSARHSPNDLPQHRLSGELNLA